MFMFYVYYTDIFYAIIENRIQGFYLPDEVAYTSPEITDDESDQEESNENSNDPMYTCGQN